jgi:16S rRNA (guanine527-N7)-methyltransferase
MIPDAQIAQGLASYGVRPDARLLGQIRDYISLLLLWNQKISLTTVVSPDEIIRFHFGESFFAVEKVPFENGRLADVGSGAGFPGIPLAMLVPELKVTLVEANLKKAAFLAEVIRKLALHNASVVRARMQDLDWNELDFITARALGHRDEFIGWSYRSLAPSGRLVLWVGTGATRAIMCERAFSWRQPIPVPGSRHRVLLIGLRN